MKKIALLTVTLLCCLGMYAQTSMNTGYLQITLNRNLLATESNGNGVCTLDSAGDDIYIHSGAGWQTITSVWDVVVGNWGMADGIGAMTHVNDSIETMCLNLTDSNNYYRNPATYNMDSGPLPMGANVYNIGCVFRWAGPWPLQPSGQPVINNNWKGAGPSIDLRGQCEDIWLLGVNSDSLGSMVQPITVQGEDGDNVPAVTTAWVATCAASTSAVKDISSQLFDNIKVSPNPFSDNVQIQFNMVPDVAQVQAQVYDVMGRRVADFSSSIRGGYNKFSWNGAGQDGIALPAGTYLLKVTNGSEIWTTKLIKL